MERRQAIANTLQGRLMIQAPPPRIFIITASEADVAIVFSRGPSGWFHLLLWDMATDTFHDGAWFKGSLYPEKCDLSPDGTLLLYFVLQGSKLRTSYTHAWTGVSRAPWMHALGLWPQGTTYGGGGRFLGNRHLVIRGSNIIPHGDHPGKGLTVQAGNPGLHTSTGEVEGATWTGKDRAGRLIYAKDGQIIRRNLDGADDVLIDLNGAKPEPQPAPSWATRDLI